MNTFSSIKWNAFGNIVIPDSSLNFLCSLSQWSERDGSYSNTFYTIYESQPPWSDQRCNVRRHSTIRDGLVTKEGVSIAKKHQYRTYRWLKGQHICTFKNARCSWRLWHKKSLVAKPPTKKACYIWGVVSQAIWDNVTSEASPLWWRTSTLLQCLTASQRHQQLPLLRVQRILQRRLCRISTLEAEYQTYSDFYPETLSMPECISYWRSLSHMVLNFMYCRSWASQNLGFIVLLKMSFICWVMSGDPYCEFASLTMAECEICWNNGQSIPVRNVWALCVTRTDPWRQPTGKCLRNDLKSTWKPYIPQVQFRSILLWEIA